MGFLYDWIVVAATTIPNRVEVFVVAATTITPHTVSCQDSCKETMIMQANRMNEYRQDGSQSAAAAAATVAATANIQ